MQNWYKNAFIDATMLFELHADLNCFVEPELLTSQIRLRTPWATEQTYRIWKPKDMKLDMSDANVQKHQFSNLPAY